MSSPRGRHLEASAGREVVFCHQCQHEWYQDEHGLECPHCESEATEIVTPENDPRDVDDTPSIPPPLDMFGHGRDSDSDPEEADIEEHVHSGPGGFFMRQTTYRSPSEGTPGRSGDARRPADPDDGVAILQRFTEMLDDFRTGQAGRSGPDTLFAPENGGFRLGGPPRHFHRTTFAGPRFSGGTTSFTIATGPIAARGPGPEAGTQDFDMIFGNIMGNVPPPEFDDANHANGGGHAAGLPPGFPATLHQILSQILNPASAVHGDAVYSQEALDRIITTLMDANPQSNAAPPATQGALDNLPRKKVDDKMLGAEGKAECTICISEVGKGDEVVSLPCNHWFHEECVVMWLKEHNTCPVCRNPIEGAGSGNNNAQQSRRSQADPSGPRPSASQAAFSSPYRRRERPPRSPLENDDRLNAILNAAGSPSYRRTPTRDRDPRRNSRSPPSQTLRAASEQPRSRHAAPGNQHPGAGDRDRDRSSSNQDPSRRGGGGVFGFLRDQFSRNSGNGSSSGGQRRS